MFFAGGPTATDIATAVLQAQAAHNAAMAAMHAHSFAAIEAPPDTQGAAEAADSAAAAAKTPVDPAAAPASHLAAEAAVDVAAADAGAGLAAEAAVAVAAEAAVAVAAADAAAGLAADAADQAVRDKAAGQEACSPKNKSPHHADQMVDQGLGRGLGWHPSSMQGRQHQHGNSWQDEEEAQTPFPLPRVAEVQPGINAETEKVQQQAEEEGTLAQRVEDGDRSIPALGEEEEYRTSLDQAHGSNQFCVAQDRQPTTETTCNALLQQQVDRFRQSAVMLPEPAEVLVTDLIDHR